MQKGRAVDYRPMGELRFLERMRRVLIDAVVAGASQILDVRGDVLNIRRYKANRELVTLADERSDADPTAPDELGAPGGVRPPALRGCLGVGRRRSA